MIRYIISALALLLFSCNSIKSIHYGHQDGNLCYDIYYNKRLEIKSFDGVEYHVYMFYINNDSLYITSDSDIPGENRENMIKIIRDDSLYYHNFSYYGKLPEKIEGKDENGYYYNYTDTIINIGYSNVKSEKSKKYFDYVIKNLKKCKN